MEFGGEVIDVYRKATEDALSQTLSKTYGSEKPWTQKICQKFASTSLDDLLFDSYFLNLDRDSIYPAVLDVIQEWWEKKLAGETIWYVVLLWAIGAGKTTCNAIFQWLQWFYLTTHWFEFRKELNILSAGYVALIQMNKEHSILILNIF